MAANKMASYRYRLIDFCLQNRQRRWTLDDLRLHISDRLYEEFDIERGFSERQLLYDVALMRKEPPVGYGAPIARKNGFVFYTDPDFSISKAPLNDADLHSLQAAIHLLRPFDELPYCEELQLTLRKLEGAHGARSSRTQPPIVLFDKSELLRGRHWLSQLFTHVMRKQTLLVSYQPFNFDSPVSLHFHPYLLKEFNSRWFVMGWNESENALWILALDRIAALEPLHGHPFHTLPGFDAARYFQDIVGVTLPADLQRETIRLRFTPHRAPYVLTKPIHTSQQTVVALPGGSVEVELTLIPNPELESLLLSFGPDVEVLEPATLRTRLARLLQAAARRYADHC